MGIDVKMIMGSYENIKITTPPEDLILAESILQDMDSIYSRREFAFQTR